MTPATGLRERKKLATRAALATSALRLAVERGPEAFTVEDISRAADVSPRTFFNYFASKEDAVLGTDPDRRARLLAALEARPAAEPPLPALRAAFVSAVAANDADPDEWAERLALIRSHPPLYARYVAAYADLERTLVAVIARRLGADPEEDPYPRLVVATAITVLRVALDHWHATGHVTAPEAAFEAAFDRLTGGLRPC